MIATIILTLFQGSGTDGTATIQAMLDMAPPGAVVRVPDFTHARRLTIENPVTLLGGGNVYPTSVDALSLDGPGSGSVTLVAITMQGAIKGGGFDELRLERVTLASGATLDGLDYLEIMGCNLLGALEAPGATVVSTGSSSYQFQGNPAVSCSSFFGQGRFPLSVDAPERHEMPFDLFLEGVARPGASIELVWRTPGPIGFLYMAEGSRKPRVIPSANFGFDHMGGINRALLVAVDTCSTKDGKEGRYTMAIPPGYALVGRQFAFQVYDPPAYYSAPAFATIR